MAIPNQQPTQLLSLRAAPRPHPTRLHLPAHLRANLPLAHVPPPSHGARFRSSGDTHLMLTSQELLLFITFLALATGVWMGRD